MAKPGPPRQPTNLRVLRGNPGKRAIPKNEPKPRLCEPEYPDGLIPRRKFPHARKEWQRIVPKLLKMNVLSEADGAALALYCWNVEMFRRCSDEIAKTKGADGMVMETPSGYQQVRPHATLAQQFQKQALAILKEFGLTPSARTSVGKIEVAEKKSEAESVLG